MTVDDFRQVTLDLEAFYNKTLNPTQKQLWFDELKNYTVEKYKKALHKICTTSQYMPALSIVLEEIRKVHEDVVLREKVDCRACKGTGYILYHKLVNGIDYEYVCQCNCQNGIGLDYDGTKVADKEHRSPYYLAKAVDVFMKEPSFTPQESAGQVQM